MLGWEVGGWVGGSNYFGDLNTNWRLNRTGLAGGAGARYNFNERLALRLGAAYGNISATDADSKNVYEQRRNLSFKSSIVEAGMHLEFNFLPYVHGHREYFYTPYVTLGPSFYHFNPKAKLNDQWYELRAYGTEGQFKGEEYNTTQGALAYGFGFKMDFNYRWSLDIHVDGRKLFTDYLDDVSSFYPDMDDLESLRGDVAVALSDKSGEPQIGQPGRQRGNGKKNDTYLFAAVGINYYFGTIRCPAWQR
jgi:opacity protein-like surface antigen